ncbi:hypothetical protein ABW19_dt0205021 [Dactylella cylindrospora]|nr:hypothetical protein ABW19_dt0205021 [Dactylella cylindrospora]
MKFNLHSFHPPTLSHHNLYRIYTSTHIFLQFYLVTALIYHGRQMDDFDALLPIHVIGAQMSTFANVVRFVEQFKEGFDGWAKRAGEKGGVGSLDGVMAGIWAFPYVMLPFALFGDYRYVGVAYLIPVPMILGYTVTRFAYVRMGNACREGAYIKVHDEEAGMSEDALPPYEERDTGSRE